MFRCVLTAVLSVALVGFSAFAADTKPAKNNQMVKGTIKSASPSTMVLVVDQQLQDGKTAERQLSITATTEFEVTINGEKKQTYGKDGLLYLEGKTGAKISVKCDKDVNVLKVTATVK